MDADGSSRRNVRNGVIDLMAGARFDDRRVFKLSLACSEVRAYTEVADDAITIPDFFDKRFRHSSSLLKIVSAVIIMIFFTLYTSSGMVSGGRLFESAFGADYKFGLFLTASVVVLYTLFGGFLAVSLTDFVQERSCLRH